MIGTHLITSLLSALAAAVIAWQAQAWRMATHISALRAEYADVVRRAEEEARSAEQAINTKYQGAINAATTRESVLRRHATAARSESDRLREQLASANVRIASAAATAVAEYAAATNELFADCSRSYQKLAGQADGHATDVRTLTEAWPANLPSKEDKR